MDYCSGYSQMERKKVLNSVTRNHHFKLQLRLKPEAVFGKAHCPFSLTSKLLAKSQREFSSKQDGTTTSKSK